MMQSGPPTSSNTSPGAAMDRLSQLVEIRDLGAGNFGVAKLMLDKTTNTKVAVKFIERGPKVDRNVEREILNHCLLDHPNIVAFKEVFLTVNHLAILMEYAAGGELFERIVKAGRFSEDEARYFFQQLISGVHYCHKSGVCHRDLKLENTLLDDAPAPRLKICDFGYSKSALDSQPKSTVGTPAYIAPEVLQRKEYSGQAADVWSCGVTLYVMLVGAYPFEDPTDPRNFKKTIQRIMNVAWSLPNNIPISQGCCDLLSRIFVANPAARITMEQIRQHPWFNINLPAELANPEQYDNAQSSRKQSEEEIRALIQAARHRPQPALPTNADPFADDMHDMSAAMGDELHDGAGSAVAHSSNNKGFRMDQGMPRVVVTAGPPGVTIAQHGQHMQHPQQVVYVQQVRGVVPQQYQQVQAGAAMHAQPAAYAPRFQKLPDGRIIATQPAVAIQQQPVAVGPKQQVVYQVVHRGPQHAQHIMQQPQQMQHVIQQGAPMVQTPAGFVYAVPALHAAGPAAQPGAFVVPLHAMGANR